MQLETALAEGNKQVCYFNIAIKVRNILQALSSFIGGCWAVRSPEERNWCLLAQWGPRLRPSSVGFGSMVARIVDLPTSSSARVEVVEFTSCVALSG